MIAVNGPLYGLTIKSRRSATRDEYLMWNPDGELEGFYITNKYVTIGGHRNGHKCIFLRFH